MVQTTDEGKEPEKKPTPKERAQLAKKGEAKADKKAKASELTSEEETPTAKAEDKSKRTPDEVVQIASEVDEDATDREYISVRSSKLDTPRWNSAPHPELWPSPDTNPDAEPREGTDGAQLRCVPATPNTNLEFVLKASGLPVNTGLVWKLEGADGTGSPTFFTPKSDPYGDCHIVWRSQKAGQLKVTITGKRDHALTDEDLASLDVTILDPANDRRFGEERGRG